MERPNATNEKYQLSDVSDNRFDWELWNKDLNDYITFLETKFESQNSQTSENSLNISYVNQHRELLVAFREWMRSNHYEERPTNDRIDEFLSNQ